MSRQVGSLHRSVSHPVSLQNPIPIIPLFAFPPPESPHINTSSSSLRHHSFSHILPIRQFRFRNPWRFRKFRTKLVNNFSAPFRPIHSQAKTNFTSTLSLSLSHISQVTPNYSPFTNERSNNNSPENTQTSYELNNLITLQQQVQHPHLLTIHQLLSTITSSIPPTPTSSSYHTPS